MTPESWAFVIIAPILFAITLPALVRQSSREGDPTLLRFLVFALFLKLIVGTLLRYYVTFYVYERADAAGYVREGTEIAQQMSQGTFHFSWGALSGTQTISFLTGVVFRFLGPTTLGGFLIFSWLAFWGMFLFYRAFVLAVPEGRARSYARLLFLLPTIWYWPSSIGKEAWMIFALGIAAFGAARALSRDTLRGITIAGLGLWLMLFVRPHMAGMFGVGFLAAFLVKRAVGSEKSYGLVWKAIGVVVVGVLAVVLVYRTAEFLNIEPTPSGAVSGLREVSTRSDYGGSRFTPIVVSTPLRVPAAIVTVLFRPFVTETDNAQALAAALESLFLLLLTLKRLPWLLAAVRSCRRQPYVALALVYSIVFVIAYASFPNFGLLARERTQLLPFYLILLSIPAVRARNEEASDSDGKSDRKLVSAAPLA
jgi:hypothetical protein